MDEQGRLRSIAAAFEQLPLLSVLVEGEQQLVVAISNAVRLVAGDRPLGSPLSEWADLVGEQVVQCYRDVYRTGEPYVGREWAIELVGVDGEPAEAVVDFTIVPVTGPDGAVTAAIGFGQDVSERIRHREQSSDLERRFEEASEVLLQLQDAVLPKGLPIPQGFEIAARYLLAEAYTGSGGDWFDAIPLADGSVAVVVGDVVGHGIEASVAMGELKVLFEESVREDGDVVASLELLDRRAERVRAARTATVCAAIVDPASGRMTYCTAGHPPPVVVSAAGDASYLLPTGSGPLGSGLPFVAAQHVLSEGDLLLLYTDGLVERPGRTPAQNTVDLLQVVGRAVRGLGSSAGSPDEQLVERVCRQALETLTRSSGFVDDITLVALQRVPPVEPLRLRLPAVPDTVRVVRADLHQWLAGLRVSELDQTAVQHAVGELVSNVVQHAYADPDAERPVSVEVRLSVDGIVDLEVADEGEWREVRPGTRGRGLAMASGFLDELHVEHDDGTRARGRHHVTHPASLLRGAATGPTPAQLVPAPFALGLHDDVVHLSGALDIGAADDLRAALRRASRGGTRTVTVDLEEVDLLCSAAVQALFDARRTGPLVLVAPMGSPAQHVLDLVRLPYRTSA